MDGDPNATVQLVRGMSKVAIHAITHDSNLAVELRSIYCVSRNAVPCAVTLGHTPINKIPHHHQGCLCEHAVYCNSTMTTFIHYQPLEVLFSALYQGIVQDELWGAGVGAEAQVKRRLTRKR
jgi:hypothetical protein